MNRKVILAILLLTGCVEIPEGIKPVYDFDINRYVGRWYEIARLDNRFERGLEQITAEYSLLGDGGIKVLNSGINVDSGKREYAEGKGYFIDKPSIGSLKVSFFGPFYDGYHIIDLDKENYKYVMISGSDKSYLWILARTPKLDETILNALKTKAKDLGYQTESLIFPKQ